MSKEEVEKVNDEYMGSMKVICTNRSSHTWNGEVCMQFLDYMAIEIRRKKIELGIEDARQSPALLLCDRCPSHLSRVFLQMRRTWAKENSVILLGCDPSCEVQIPGGFGACLGPNDR